MGDGKSYGILSWRTWKQSKPGYLWGYRQTPEEADRDIHPVHSYQDLFRVVAFLNVMNKNSTLLFRGQEKDLAPVPTLLRDTWKVPGFQDVDISEDRKYYAAELNRLCDHVAKQLEGRLPRHAPFDEYPQPGSERLRVAPWAVIQHYDLWPTPLLDLTSSLRVAASFALGVEQDRPEGFVYVYDIKNVVSDLPALRNARAPPDPITYRLSAVCPPDMDRPHLQEGFLFGHSLFGPSHLDVDRTSIAGRLVAKFRLEDMRKSGRSTFWSADFPKHSKNSLLPGAADDEVKERLTGSVSYGIEDGKAVWSVTG